MTTMTEEQIANLSDDEIMGIAIPPSADTTELSTDDQPEAESLETAQEPQDAPEVTGSTEAGAEDEDGLEEASEGIQETGEEGDQFEDPASGSTDSARGGDPKTQSTESETSEQADTREASASTDYKAMYEKIMAPFKANGKEIKLQSPEEVVQLMQMGANYTKKLQALQPNLKLLKMLENNNLLDEGKLSFLIDVEQRNPKAIQKLLKDGGLDPLDIDTSVESDYKPGNHRVLDEDIRFSSTVEEVASMPVGKDLISVINRSWDTESKNALWKDPEILRVLTDQKSTGIFDQISNEVERQRMLGRIGSTVPFIRAYQMVGQEMTTNGAFAQQPQAAPSQAPAAHQQTSRVVDTRPAPRKTIANNDRARAASPTRSAPKAVSPDFNPLALSDEDFEKNSALAQRL